MANLPWGERHVIAVTRLRNILRSHVVANDRILEQKIADAGPGPQRVDPHILTVARARMIQQRIISVRQSQNMPWYYLANTDPEMVEARFQILVQLQKEAQVYSSLVGQALEIAVLRALRAQTELTYIGDFLDLEEHDDSSQYSKEEPPASLSGRRIPGRKRLDFLVHHEHAGYAGIEVKNVRQWFYPDREEIREMLLKCCALDIIPVLIARRIHYSTFSVLNPCGVIIHQTYNQLYPNCCAADLVPRLRDRDLLGFHDIRAIDAADANGTHARLSKFIHHNLPQLLPSARTAFDEYKDLLAAYATGEYPYKEFAARVKRRYRNEPEDLTEAEPGPPDDEW